MAERIPARLTTAEGRKFALTVGTAFLVLAALTWWRDHLTVAKALGGIGGVLWLGGLVVPGRMGPLYRLWMGLAHAISKVTTPIFLGIVFFLVIMPIGVVMRALGRNPIRHEPKDESYWARHAESSRGSLTNQF